MKRASAAILFFLLSVTLFASGDTLSFWRDAPSLSRKRLFTVAGIETAGWAGSVVILSKAWYDEFPKTGFHSFNDNREWRGMDKAGHIVTSYTLGNYGLQMLRWSGVNDKGARWLGGTVGLVYLGTLEMFDAYSQGWGFSWGDMAANVSGAGILLLQDKCWNEQRFRFKYSFRNTGLSVYRPELLGRNRAEQLVKDYNSQTYWISFSPGKFAGENSRWPRWLCLAAGYSAEGMTGGTENPKMTNSTGQEIFFKRYSQFCFSLDLDLSEIPIHCKAWKAFSETFGFIKIPAPGIVIGNGTVLPRLLCY